MNEVKHEIEQLKSEINDLNTRFKKNQRLEWLKTYIPLYVAIIGFVSMVVGNILQQQRELKSENMKHRSNMVLKAFESGDTTKAAALLNFYIDKKLIDDDDNSLKIAAKNPSSLPVNMFNHNAPVPTVAICNTKKPCPIGPISGCWQTSTSANPGDTIIVQVFFENSGSEFANQATVSIKPKSTGKILVKRQTFIGGVASLNMPRSVGNAIVYLSQKATIQYIQGSALLYKSSTERFPVNASALFGDSGYLIEKMYPGEKGVIIALFSISN